MIIDGELHTVTQTLSLNHLGQAFDSLLSARDACDIKPTNRANILATRYSISSVIHGFAALESEVSTLGYEMFSNSGSQLFLPPERRPFLVQRLAQSWNGAPVLDKLFFLSSKDGVVILPEQLQQRLRELNTLRNWLVHGFTYTTTLLLRPKGDNSFDVLDTEDSVEWARKFPQTKFNPVGELTPIDARTALQIVLEALELLSQIHNRGVAVLTAFPRLHFQILPRGKVDVDAIASAIPR